MLQLGQRLRSLREDDVLGARALGFLNISFEMILYFDQQISIRPHFIYQNILIKIQNLKLSAKTQMSSHSHPTDPDTVAHRTSAVSIAPHLELSQDAGTIRSLAPFSPPEKGTLLPTHLILKRISRIID